MAGLDILTYNKFDVYKADGNKAVKFKLVRDDNNILDRDDMFHAAMCHQTFGASELIFGYIGLHIDFIFVASSLKLLVRINYASKVDPLKDDGMEPDDIMEALKSVLPDDYCTNLDTFVPLIDEAFQPFGEKLTEYTVQSELDTRSFEVYKCNTDEPGFVEYIERFQTFIMFFLDASVFIDTDDNKFDYYITFEKYTKNSETHYASLGFMISYNFYAYPEMVRPRICQMLILPPFQRQGHCSKLLQCFYDDCLPRKYVRDITVEDASDNLQKVRDIIDTRNCVNLSCFTKENIVNGFNKDIALVVLQKLKINKKQARRVYEILRYKYTNIHDEKEYTSFKNEIYKRLNEPFKKNGREVAKLRKSAEALSMAQQQERQTLLDEEYEKCLKCYEAVNNYLS